MALFLKSFPTSAPSSCSRISSPLRCAVALNSDDSLKDQTPTVRRSGNYQPPIWGFEYIQSLKNDYAGPSYVRRRNEVKEQVLKMVIDEDLDMLSKLELISDLERLGVSYHFQDEIQSSLSRIHKGFDSLNVSKDRDLYATALGFRVLRQYGFHVSQDVFNCFMDDKGEFEQLLAGDIKGLLELYEASYLLTENETTMESAREFAAKVLETNVDKNGKLTLDPQMAELVKHALELPLHWRMRRAEARWFIDVYEKGAYSNPVLVEFAKLDFNIVQAVHQEELKYASRWWTNTGLAKRLPFARDRLVEAFWWGLGMTFEPQYGYCRRMATKAGALVTVVDDIYDVYATMDEIENFTSAVKRWDTEAIGHLPNYMKQIYLAVNNSINEVAYDALKEQDAHIVSHIRKKWVDLCEAYLQEAKWFYSGYVPTLQEYLDNAWISVGFATALSHIFFTLTNPITKEALECLDNYHNVIRASVMVIRLADDLGTSSDEIKRGDVPKSIQCYMHETGASEEEAREYVRLLIQEAWKQINKENRIGESFAFSPTFLRILVNAARVAQDVYHHGDGHGHSNHQMQDEIRSVLFEPIHLQLHAPTHDQALNT